MKRAIKIKKKRKREPSQHCVAKQKKTPLEQTRDCQKVAIKTYE